MDRIIKTIDSYENKALELGDLKTAIKLNWLRNAVRFDGLDLEVAAYQLLALVILGKFEVAA